MSEHDADKENHKEMLRRTWRKDEQLPEKFGDHLPGLLTTLEEFESIWTGHVERANLPRTRTDLMKCDVVLVHSVPNRAGSTAREFTSAYIGDMVTKKGTEPVTTAWAAPFVISPKTYCPLRISFAYSKSNAVTIRDWYGSTVWTNVLETWWRR